MGVAELVAVVTNGIAVALVMAVGVGFAGFGAVLLAAPRPQLGTGVVTLLVGCGMLGLAVAAVASA